MGSRGFLKLRAPKERITGSLVGGYSLPKGLGLSGGNAGEGWLLSASLFLFSIIFKAKREAQRLSKFLSHTA